MELTIIQSGALYAMQHKPLRNFRRARRRQAIARRTIRTATKRQRELLADRKIETEEGIAAIGKNT